MSKNTARKAQRNTAPTVAASVNTPEATASGEMTEATDVTAPVVAIPDAAAVAKAEKAEAAKVAKAAKVAAAAAAKLAAAAKRADGVIGTICSMISSETGATRKEVIEALTEKFPTRDPLGMAVTVGIQFSRLTKKVGPINNAKVTGRGRVYKVATAGSIIGAEVAPTDEPVAATTEQAEQAA